MYLFRTSIIKPVRTGIAALSGLLALTLFSCNAPSLPPGNRKLQAQAMSMHTQAIAPPYAKGPRRILFVGNSHLQYYISIPELFAELCRFNKVPIREERVVEMGISLQEIYRDYKDKVDQACARKDDDGNYFDYVVLQERTPVVTGNAAEYKASVHTFMSLIRRNSPDAVFLVYEMAPSRDYQHNQEEFRELYRTILEVNREIVAENSNTKLYRVAEAIDAAYRGQSGYQYFVGGRDRLRHGSLTLHLLNDSGFMAAVQLYFTLFGKEPAVPDRMPFTDDTLGRPRPNTVKEAVSNPEALLQIAMNYH